jgi:hypothetical protein
MRSFITPNVKKKGKAFIFFFGLAVFIAMLVRVFRSGARKPAEVINVVKGEVKDLTRLQTVLMVLGSAFTFGLMAVEYASAGTPGVYTAVALGTLTTGDTVVTTFNTTYVPKFIQYAAATQLDGIKITVQGDGVIFDSDTEGLNSAGVLRQFGQVTNGFLITIANGFIPGKNVIWEFTNSAAQTPVIYVSSDETAQKPMYLQMLRQAVLANSGQNFTDFATLALPSLGASDVINILYNDGTQQQFNRAELGAYLQFTQNVIGTRYTIDNFAGRIKLVNVIAASAQTAYVQRWVSAAPGGMLNQSVNN